ncbi:MAG: hypothetical protein LBG27_01135 [Spirochaetaceae bacterium]|jgi:hypothetical protein|nr:hypothetical protein [Spirochaetaceae bacterium]
MFADFIPILFLIHGIIFSVLAIKMIVYMIVKQGEHRKKYLLPSEERIIPAPPKKYVIPLICNELFGCLLLHLADVYGIGIPMVINIIETVDIFSKAIDKTANFILGK